MKKLFLLIPALFLLLLLPSPAPAQSGGFQGGPVGQNNGGFSGPGLEQSTVEQALTLRDDAYVILRGNIIRHLGKDKYLFRDSTGEINVDIDRDKWNGQNVTPENTVEIQGEIDKDWNSIEVDVDRLTLLK
ncbi:MAG: YgiW/YdeI family stress tolerance OB fold protein [Deltaproteobacteria bacterium]|jgi:uncharacterized protein (TIGR00156 family)|nr:YgiW/YdeI family stress tolerance OB fold protein [Deltaproteobacteria bacterium]